MPRSPIARRPTGRRTRTVGAILGSSGWCCWTTPTAASTGRGSGAATPFSRIPVAEVAARVADVCRGERVGAGRIRRQRQGTATPDHRHVHDCARSAAQSAGCTCSRQPLRGGRSRGGAVGGSGGRCPDFDPEPLPHRIHPSHDITHRVDVRDYVDFKRASLRAHASQSTGRGRAPSGRCCGCPVRCSEPFSAPSTTGAWADPTHEQWRELRPGRPVDPVDRSPRKVRSWRQASAQVALAVAACASAALRRPAI